MTVYELIQALASFPADAEVLINAMHRDRWRDDREQAVINVRWTDHTHNFRRVQGDKVCVYGNKRPAPADEEGAK